MEPHPISRRDIAVTPLLLTSPSGGHVDGQSKASSL
jgi:hypothetical protein